MTLLERRYDPEHDTGFRPAVRPPVRDRTHVGHRIPLRQLNLTLPVDDGQGPRFNDDALGSHVTERLTLVREPNGERTPDDLERPPHPRREKFANDTLTRWFLLEEGQAATLIGPNDRIKGPFRLAQERAERCAEGVGHALEREKRRIPKSSLQLADESKAHPGSLTQRVDAEPLPLTLETQLTAKRRELRAGVVWGGRHSFRITGTR